MKIQKVLDGENKHGGNQPKLIEIFKKSKNLKNNYIYNH